MLHLNIFGLPECLMGKDVQIQFISGHLQGVDKYLEHSAYSYT